MVASCTPHSHSGWCIMDSLDDLENMEGIGDFECMKGSVHLECMGNISHFEGIVSIEFVRSKSYEGRHFVNRDFVVGHDGILLGICIPHSLLHVDFDSGLEVHHNGFGFFSDGDHLPQFRTGLHRSLSPHRLPSRLSTCAEAISSMAGSSIRRSKHLRRNATNYVEGLALGWWWGVPVAVFVPEMVVVLLKIQMVILVFAFGY
nr:hypothetical protein Iba_chr12aCG2450 [Ipomoea batatas]